jgi:hypothetical protein
LPIGLTPILAFTLKGEGNVISISHQENIPVGNVFTIGLLYPLTGVLPTYPQYLKKEKEIAFPPQPGKGTAPSPF